MQTHRVLSGMFLVLVFAGCAGSRATDAPTPTVPPIGGTQQPGSTAPRPTDGPEALVADLVAAGMTVRLGPLFTGDPLAAQGVVMCVGTQPVQLYVFGSVAERVALTSRIDPANPSNLGTTIIDWNGRPRMWQRDRLLIVYLGEDAATEQVLRSALGEPFAVAAQGRPPLRADTCA